MKIIIARHGETLENIKGIIQGQNPGTLSPLGISQAKKLAERLKKEKIDIIYCSDLKRASDTAQEILKYQKAPVIFTEILRDRCMGVFEGKPKESCSRAEQQKYFDFVPENGESYQDFEKRVRFFYDYIYLNYPSQTVLILTHTRFIKVLLSIILNKKLEEIMAIPQANACVNIINIKNYKQKVQTLNCTRHL